MTRYHLNPTGVLCEKYNLANLRIGHRKVLHDDWIAGANVESLPLQTPSFADSTSIFQERDDHDGATTYSDTGSSTRNPMSSTLSAKRMWRSSGA